MGSPVICPKHGRVSCVATSPVFAKAIADGSGLSDECRIVTLEVDAQEELGKTTKHFVDMEFLARISLLPSDGFLTLKDRSKKNKLMNDRAVLSEIFSETIMVCHYCLDELVSRHRDRKEAT